MMLQVQFLHQKGWIIFNKLIEYMRNKQEANGYVEVSSPTVLDRSLWENQVTGKSLKKICI